MSAHERALTSLLDLPPEIRQQIFVDLFRSTVICEQTRWQWPVGILRACRATYREAAPLVLPNVCVYCDSSMGLLQTLGLIGAGRIPQLRHLVLCHEPIAIKLEGYEDASSGEEEDGEEEGGEEDGSEEEEDGSEDEDGGFVRWFDTGAQLGLFPGLQLDLLEVLDGVGSFAMADFHNTGTFDSLLRADGYRRVWMQINDGDGYGWMADSFDGWDEVIERKFKPHIGWRAQVNVDRRVYEEGFWKGFEDAGITVVDTRTDSDDRQDGDDESDLEELLYGFRNEHAANVVLDRGDAADISVKLGDDQVLECIDLWGEHQTGPRSSRRASDALKKLFRENSWEALCDMGVLDVIFEADEAYNR